MTVTDNNGGVDLTGVEGFDALPPSIQQMQWRDAAIATDEQFAYELYLFAYKGKGEYWTPKDASVDYPDKDFFMRIAESLPAAYKIKGTPLNANPDEARRVSVLDYVDGRKLFEDYALSNPDDKEKALRVKGFIADQYKKTWSEQGEGAQPQQTSYEQDSGGLSPAGYITAQVAAETASALPPGAGFDPSALENVQTAQEYAQTFADTTLADLGFDENLRFNLSGLVAGAPVGPEGGYDAYKAPQFLYTLTPEQLGKLSGALQRAGYFDLVGALPSDPTDNRDRAIRTAWDYFLVDVVAAGEQAKPQDVLNARIKSSMKEQMPFGATYADQATLRQMANEFGRGILGRNLSQDEQDSFIGAARKWEQEAIRKFGVGQDQASFTQDTERVDVQSRAELWFQTQYAADISKSVLYDWAKKFK